MRLAAFLLVALALPLAGALPGGLHGANVCEDVDSRADAVYDDNWYEACGGAMSAYAAASVSYTQVETGCAGNTCYYQPTFHVALDTLAPGDWIVRGSSVIRHYPTPHYVLPGSYRELECRASALAPCASSATNVQVMGNPFNSAKWEGEWRLYFRDATGAEHLQASGAGGGWLAQYYSG